MPDYLTLMASDPAAYAEAASGLEQAARDVDKAATSFGDAVTQAQAGWIGTARDAHSVSAAQMSTNLSAVSGALNRAAAVVADGGTQLTAIVTGLRSGTEAAQASGFLVLPEGIVVPGPAHEAQAAAAGPGAPAVMAAYEAMAAEQTGVLESLVADANLVDEQTAQQLESDASAWDGAGGFGGKKKAGPLPPGRESGPWVKEAKNLKLGGAVAQSTPGSCVSAVGEMLTGGKITEAQLLAKLGEWSDPASLARELNAMTGGQAWRGAMIGNPLAVAHRGGSFGAALQPPYNMGVQPGHMVFVEPLDAGTYLVRDPLPGVTYEVDDAWLDKWMVGAVWK